MDSFELNKLIGAFLGVVFIVFSVSLASDAIFSSSAPETPGYHIEVVEDEGGEAAEEEAVNVAALMAEADASAGESAFRRCASCHSMSAGENRVGPYLYDIVGREVATAEGFSYSGPMSEYGADGTTWDYENLFHFLQNPRGYVSGTTMAFAGLSNDQENANLIAYMREQSDDPLPLPEVTEDEEATEEDAAGEGAAEDETAEEDAEANGEAEPNGEAAGDEADTDAEPVEPTPEDDGTAAGPEPDAGTEATDNGEAANGEEAETNGEATGDDAGADATQDDADAPEPTTEDDGTAAGPEPDAGTPAGEEDGDADNGEAADDAATDDGDEADDQPETEEEEEVQD